MQTQQQDMSGEIIRACVDVHRGLGPGFKEQLYQQALVVELKKRGLPFEAGKSIQINYDGQEVGSHRLDLVVNDQIVMKLLAAEKIEPKHYAQVRSYVRAAQKHIGLLVNFADSKIDVRRVEV
ncbi:MAG: GxxExxY protein [Candidatus Xenobia bacterium]